MKRSTDVVLATLAIALTSPMWVWSALCVKWDSPGSVFFRQERIGVGGRPFKIFKFRSMVIGESGALVTVDGDARITRSGRWLRAHKIDELPQLLNVVKGDMSIVGPRPEIPDYVDMWSADDRAEVLSVRPGITDPASVKYIDEQSVLARVDDPVAHYANVLMPAKVRLYREYIRNQSFVGDLKIMWLTAAKLMSKLA